MLSKIGPGYIKDGNKQSWQNAGVNLFLYIKFWEEETIAAAGE